MQFRRPALVFAALFLLLANLLGCQSTLPDQAALAAPDNIINSVDLASQANTSTVALIYLYHSGNMGALCSGVWVSHDVILTAAHCVTGFTRKHNQEVTELNKSHQSELPTVLPIGLDVPYIIPKEAPLVDTAPTVPVHHATVFYYVPSQDLALLRTQGQVPSHTHATVATSLPRMGQHLNLMGHPDGMYFSYMEGLVSAIRLQIPQDNPSNKEPIINGPFIQFQAPITHGDSGGGIFDMQGHLIGIISFMDKDAPGSGFAIHGITVRQILQSQHIIPSPILHSISSLK